MHILITYYSGHLVGGTPLPGFAAGCRALYCGGESLHNRRGAV